MITRIPKIYLPDRLVSDKLGLFTPRPAQTRDTASASLLPHNLSSASAWSAVSSVYNIRAINCQVIWLKVKQMFSQSVKEIVWNFVFECVTQILKSWQLSNIEPCTVVLPRNRTPSK